MLRSIRDHLAASVPYDAVRAEAAEETEALLAVEALPQNNNGQSPPSERNDTDSLVETFRENLEAVGGHCIVAQSEREVAAALTRFVADLQKTPLRAKRIALSNAPVVERLTRQIEAAVDGIAVAPSAGDLFDSDV